MKAKFTIFFLGIFLLLLNVRSFSQDVSFNVVNATNPGCGDGYIETTVNGGIQPLTFNWTWDDGSGPSIFSTSAQSIYQLRADYTYCVTITDALCREIRQCFELKCCEKIPDPEIRAYCSEDSKGSIIFDSSLSSHYLISWEGPDGFSWSGTQNSNLKPGEYKITFDNEAECVYTFTYTIEEFNLSYSLAEIENPKCAGYGDEGRILLDVNGQANITWYNASNGYPVGSPIDTGSELIAGEGEYIAVISTQECEIMTGEFRLTCCSALDEDGEPYTILPSPIFTEINTLWVSSSGVCDGFITYTDNQPNYVFTTLTIIKEPEGIELSSLNDLCEGRYCLTLDNGCDEVMECIEIGNCETANIEITGSETPTCKDVGFGSIELSISGGNSPFSFNWSNGATESSIDLLAAGIYSVTVTDLAGCQQVSEDFEITDDVEPVETYLGDCKFEVECNGEVIPGYQREGVIEEELDENNCKKRRTCVDDFFPSGTDDLGVTVLETYIETLNTTTDGCWDLAFKCVGLDEVAGTEDDNTILLIFPFASRSEVKNTSAGAACASCFSATVCEYPGWEEFNYVTNVMDEFVTFDPEPGYSLCPEDKKGCQVSFGCAFVTTGEGLIIPAWNECVDDDVCGMDIEDIDIRDYINICDIPSDQAFIDALDLVGVDTVSEVRSKADTEGKIEKSSHHLKRELTILIYPNPTMNLFHVKLLNAEEKSIDRFIIVDISGNKVDFISNQIAPNEITVDLSELQSGIYIGYFYTSSGKVFTRKIIKI